MRSTKRFGWRRKPPSWDSARNWAGAGKVTLPFYRSSVLPLVRSTARPFYRSSVLPLGGPRSAPQDGEITARAALVHPDLRRHPLPQLSDVAHQAHDAAAVTQAVQDVHHFFQRVFVQGAEPLVDEQGLDRRPARLRGDHIGQTESEGEASKERLATGQ